LTGRYRDEQVWIGGGSVSPHGAMFVPPHHSRVGAAMDDLLAFMRRDDVPVLAQAAIAHAQFETIHPFPDGNGRTGRAIVQAILRNKRLTTNVTVPVSAGLLHNVDAYYDALGAYRTGDINPIVGAFAEAAGYGVRNGRKLVGDIRSIEHEWSLAMTGLRADAAARKVATLAIGQPVLNQALITSRLKLAPPTAYRAIEALVERGVLRPANSKSRNRIWIADRMIDALDAFAARAGRRELPRRG
ncbi:MAG: Fic family protein, partial [Leifsonia sp.]